MVRAGLRPLWGSCLCLTYHRLIGDHRANDAFIIRGHFDAAGRLIPERVVSYSGSDDNRGVGSLKVMRMMWDFRGQLYEKLDKEGRPVPVVRPTPGA